MGKLISNKAFESYEYLTALLISMGMTLFLLGSSTNQDSEFSVSLVGGGGFITLVAYMIFDSFTSTWQSELFRSYKISSWRMMIGVNFCALLFATAPLIQQGTMLNNLRFLTEVNLILVKFSLLERRQINHLPSMMFIFIRVVFSKKTLSYLICIYNLFDSTWTLA